MYCFTTVNGVRPIDGVQKIRKVVDCRDLGRTRFDPKSFVIDARLCKVIQYLYFVLYKMSGELLNIFVKTYRQPIAVCTNTLIDIKLRV